MGLGLNLREQLVFYGAYHSNRWNQLIHFVFVPAIFWSVAVWLAYTPEFVSFSLSEHVGECCPEWVRSASEYALLNGSFFATAAYGLYYVSLEWFAGLSWTLLAGLPMWVSANAFASNVPDAWLWAVGVHVLSWVVQVYVGHVIAEKRKPALLDSFFQSLVLAPLFVWFEMLFVLGYRPALQAELASGIREVRARDAALRQPLKASSGPRS